MRVHSIAQQQLCQACFCAWLPRLQQTRLAAAFVCVIYEDTKTTMCVAC
jgi:hypothetical protein